MISGKIVTSKDYKSKTMKKLSVLMTILLMAVGVAQAADVYPLWVKGVQVTSDNRRDVLEDGTV